MQDQNDTIKHMEFIFSNIRAVSGAVLVVLGLVVKYIQKKIKIIDTQQERIIELESKVEDIISHEAGRNSFSRGLYQISERVAKQEEKTAHMEKEIDRIIDKEK